MLSVKKPTFLLALITAFFPLIISECRNSFVTICDTFDDFKNYTDTENLSELMIGSERGEFNKTSVDLMRTLDLNKYHKLKSLMVVKAVNKLDLTYGFQCTYHTSRLEYMIFYGNQLKNIVPYQFPLVPLKKMSLINNQIETIADWSFKYYEIQQMDLSDNLLDVVVSGSLPSTNVTKIITIKNNQLTHIEPKSFPSNLESLNLDQNKLRYLQNDVLDNLINLKELTLSHNKFNAMPEISHLTELIIFDISFNAISTIKSGTFKDMPNLKLIDLSNNNIDSALVMEWLHNPKKQPTLTISLGLNRLRELDLEKVDLENKTLVLYGNPWDCNTWPQLAKELQGHESKCDLEFLSKGSVPFCINYRAGSYVFTSLWENDIDEFHQTVRESEKKANCVLAPKRYQWLYPIHYGCVA